MSKKPAAALSANLVAVKGTAAPASDMPGRAGVPCGCTPVAGGPMPPEPSKDAATHAATSGGAGGSRRTSRSIFGCPTPSGGNSRSMRPPRAQAQ